MAEFKLGRIRFVWQGAWVTGTTYYKDDVVRFGGKVYLCQIGHTAAADFNTDLDIVPTKWNLMNDGQRWTGDWTTATQYEEGDLAKYGGTIYVCTNGHTSAATAALGLENNEPADWDTFVEGFDWKGDWTTSTRYKFNDIVRYGGINYVCITGHTSAATESSGLETDSANWQVFTQGQEYKGTWVTATRYKLNDVVKWGAGLWICTTQHTSNSFPSDSANWAQFNEGFEFASTWSSGTAYQPGDVVSYGGNRYIAKTLHTNSNPLTGTSNWDLYSEGLSYQSTWANTTSYKIGQVVQYGGHNYLAVTDSPSATYTVTAVTASTDRFTIADTTGIVAGMSVRFTGTTIGDVFTGGRYYVKTVAAGYITISDAYSGSTYNVASDASGSMTATISAEPPHPTYWTDISRGFYWRGDWSDDTEYNAGDVVKHNANAYICILAHRSEGDDGSTIRSAGGGQANSRPDLDASGTYWNTLTVGSETSVLTTVGDMVYYGGAGPTRLPVGTEGQVLRVSSTGIPEWVTWGTVDHVYYVAPTGENRPYPDCGASLDKPWASIRYACQQVEKGCRNPQARHLLEMNRVFIQREVTSWIDYQIANAGGTGIWASFDYDEYKCERDVGFIVDRIIWDITHGGNLKTLSAALTYINALSAADLFATADDENGTGTYSKLSTEGDNDVAAFEYMETVITAVLANTAPATVYQTLALDSTAIAEQFIDTNYVAETGVTTEIAALVDIVTTALADGNADNLPARLVPSNSINIKTGNYLETLPIIVPAETALIGDEVRSVHVSPRTGTTPREDSFYTVASMDRLASVVNSIVQGSAVTETTGNAETQTTDWPVSTSSVADLATSKIRALKYNIDFRLGTINSFSYPDPTDYNTAYLTGYGDARTLILANKEFFKAQVEVWLTTNYPSLYYSRTACKRDVGYIVDALVYDLTYDGNAMSVQAGLAYYQGVGSSLYIDSTEKTATLAAYAYLKSMILDAAANTTITSLQGVETQYQNVALTGGSLAVTFLGDCLDEMIDIVDNGPSAETLTDPSTSWVASAYTSDYSSMNSAVSTIQTGTIDYINTNFGNFTYNSTACRRDIGYLVDAAYYDAAFGSNFWAVQNGISYKRIQASVVTTSQLEQELGSIAYVKTQAAAALASNSTAVTRSNATYVEILDIINNGVGSADALVFTDTGTANFTNARAQLVTNRAFIISEMVTWMTANVPGYVALSAAGKALCQRDLGYAIDALAYDVNYGGNLATRNFCRSLFNTLTGVGIESVNSGTTYTQLGVVCAQIVQETYAGQDTSGTAASGTEGTRMTTLCGNISTVATAGNLSGLVAESAPSITWAAAGIQTAVGALASAKTTIVADTLQYITDTFSDFSYNHAKCSRDVATIIKAVGYDMMFNANFQSLKAGYAYLRATATEVFDLNQKSVSRAALTYVRDQLLTYTSNATAEARIAALFLAIDDIIYSGSNEGAVCQSEDRVVDYAALQLLRNKDFIIAELDAWMNYNYVNFDNYYNAATCSRDIGYIIDAVVSDLATGSNFASSVAGESYYRIQAALVPGAQLMQTVAAVKEAKRLATAYVTDSSLYTAFNAAFDNIIAILSGGLTAVPTYTWPDNGTSTATDVSDAAALQTNRATMITGIETYLSTTSPYDTVWSGLTLAQKNACKRDVGYIIDAVTYDLQYGGDMQSTIAGSAYYSFGTLEIATGEKAATLAALTQLGTLMKAYTSAGGDTKVDAKIAVTYGIINTGAAEPMTYTKPSVAGESAAKIATHAAILGAKSTIQTGVTTFISDTFGNSNNSYTYNRELCNRDTAEIIDSLIWDLKYSSNYKTLLCGRWYANAVLGSEEEDMYYLRNGTGVRNMTLEGLNGDLTPENAYGTRRVTAGAYASLDPGWGPADFRTWIMTRSPYVQNCCTFGNAAIGQKIDGALHNGGNKSIVSNDFTQIISDGIGAWVTNDARAELVSVFTYYSHIGYLSENGGRIRGTNGNNSYGDFGSVAEGYDVNETPIYCQVDNKAYDVAVGSVLTDGINYPWQFEYDNAGSDYTSVTWSLAGGGSLAEVEQADFRDGAVYQVRLLDNVDDSALAPEASGNYGGFGYISNANTAQSGTTTQLTLAAVDDEISAAYVGMKLLLTGGTGAGQYGIIDTYTSGTKIATVVKESTGGAGWDHVVPGTAIVAPDASTTYIVEPAISFTAPTYSSTARTLGTAQTYSSATYAPTFGVYTPLSGTTSGAGTGATFTVVRKGVKYSNVSKISSGTGYARLDTITILGTSLGGATTTNDITITITSVNSTTGAIQAFEFTGFGCGGNFAAIASGSRNVNTSTNGTTWAANTTALPSTSNWAAMAGGALTVVESAGSFVTGRAYVITSLGNTVFTNIGASANIVGTYFVAIGAGSGSGTATPIANHLVAVSGSTTVNAYSTDAGVTWTAGGALPAGMSGTAVDVAYGLNNGVGTWVAIGSGGATAYSTNGGVSWSAGGALPSGTSYISVTYGQGVWVAVEGNALSSTKAAYSTDGGENWVAATLPTSTNWISVTYGNNKFVAVSSDGSVSPAYSVDKGATWSNTGTAGWLNQTVTSVSYGQGVFVASNSTSNNMASSQDGINWTTRSVTRASGTGILTAVHGNPHQSGIWAIIPSASTTAASSAILGATAKGRAYVSSNKIYAIRITDPGSAYASAPTLTITDPSNLYEAPTTVRIGNGACGPVDWISRGSAYDSAIAEIDTGDGYANNYQSGQFMAVSRLTGIPEAGANVVFSTQPNTVYKLVQVLSQTGEFNGGRGAFLQISPDMSVYNSPADGTAITTRIRYSQVRLTGHDFLDIGTGSFTETNYPGEPTQAMNQLNETVDNNGGRVFYTSTDQDGNFRVGELFVIEQATGKATLNADAFNIAGLSELSLGNITLGGNSATVTEFSTDPFLTANSDSVVPTQRAIKAYIAAQIGGGGASLNVNSIVAGFIEVAGTHISTTTGGTIQMKANFNFQAGVRGYPVAWNYFLNN